MAVTTRGGMTVPDLSVPEIDPAIAVEEARHLTGALILGLDVIEARADNPTPEMGGYVKTAEDSWRRPRENAIMTLLGRWGTPGWPPECPSKRGASGDERHLADEVESIGRGRAGYEDVVADASRLVARPEFKSLADMFETLLARGCVLRKDHIRTVYEAWGSPGLDTKTIKAATRVGTDLGEFTALAAAWSKDRQGDQIVRGAFTNTIKAWRERNRPIPLHWAHKGDAEYVIGAVDPQSVREIAEGLYVKGKLDLDGSEMAREAWRLVKSGTAALSFGYMVTDAVRRSDGIQELREIDLYEISLTPTPANPDTRILSFKSTDPPESEPEPGRQALSPEWQGMRDRARDEMYALLTAPLESDPDVALEREAKRQQRELRRQCDRMRLEEALGWDADLINRFLGA